MRRVALTMLVLLISSCAKDERAKDAMPFWLESQTWDYNRMPASQVPSEIWRITHKGKPTYFVISACCDHLNPLLSDRGEEICSPTGGIAGRGDRRCANPVDPGTQPVLVWSHPKGGSDHPVPEF